MEEAVKALKNFKVHGLALALTVVCEFMGTKIFKLPIGSVAFFPMLYALVLGFVIGLPKLKILSAEDQMDSAYLLNLSVLLLIARYGTLVGPNFFKIINSGLALVLQEFGNIGTAVFAVPIAVFLGLGRGALAGARGKHSADKRALWN